MPLNSRLSVGLSVDIVDLVGSVGSVGSVGTFITSLFFAQVIQDKEAFDSLRINYG